MNAEPQTEHQWLDRLVGEWTYETEATMEPGQPPAHFTGTENVRSLGGLWVLCEGRGEMPGGGTATTIMTLGYDPVRQHYLGTFIASMMTHLWVYAGELDLAGKVLTLETEGPSCTVEGKMTKYKDIIELIDEDHRVLRSEMLGEDGEWRGVMNANYRRAK
jgi:hypothetical protein